MAGDGRTNDLEERDEAQQYEPGNSGDKPGTIEVIGASEEQPIHIEAEATRLRVGNVMLATAGVLGVLLLAYLVSLTLHLFLLLFLALLVATAIEPMVNLLRRGPLNRSAGILVSYTAIFLVIGAIGWLVVPIIFAQIGALGESLPRTVNEMQAGVEREDNALMRDNPFLRQQANLFLRVAERAVGKVKETTTPEGGDEQQTPAEQQEEVEAVTTTTRTLAEVLFAIVTIFVVAYYWLAERILIKRAVMSWFPARRANRIRRVWDDIEVKVGGWVRGQLLLMLIVGVASAIGYFIIGVDYWPALALFIGLAEAIPLVGPYIGTAPAVMVALTQPGGGWEKALAVVIFAIVLQTVEGNVLIPRIMKNTVGISPLVVIVSILFGAVLAGLAGALVAVPLAGAIQVIVQDIRAARESEAKLERITEEAEETRAEAGELVVAHPSRGETKTTVQSTEAADAKT